MNRKLIMKSQTFALSALCVAMVGCGGSSSDLKIEDDPVLPPSAFDGTATLSGDTTVGSTLTAAVADDNGISGTITYTWSADGTAIAGANGATYVLTDNELGTTVSVTATYTDDDSFDETVVATIDVADPNVNSPATFAGLTASVAYNDATEQSGTITVTDANEGEATLEAQTAVSTMYGTFSVLASGAWTYTLDITDSTVSSLNGASDSIVDTVQVESADGTTADLAITISGVDTASTNKAAKITDPGDDTGELRYGLGDGALQGKLTASIYKNDNAIGIKDGESAAKDAYITFYNSTGSTSSGRAIADLRIQADKFALRDQDDIDVTNPFVPDSWHDIEVTWEAADADTPPMVTVTIDGVAVTTEAFSSPAAAIGGVTNIAFRFSDNDSVVADAAYFVDDIKIYSDAAGSTLVWEDDFEGYAIETRLDKDENSDSPYSTSSYSVEVAHLAREDSSAGGGKTGKIVKITDPGDDTGELRYGLGDGALQGKVTASILKNDNAIGIKDGESAAKDAYITLYNSTGSTSSGRAIADLRIQADKFALRDQDDIDVEVPYMPDTWHDIEITWEAADATTPPMVTVTIDGVSVTAEAFSSPAAAIGGVTNIAFRFSDNDSVVADAAYYVDDLKIYSDAAGTTILWEDDFEGYAIDTSLDKDVNGDSPYSTSSYEATVVAAE